MSRPVVMAALAAVLALVGLTVIWFVVTPASDTTPPAAQAQRQSAEDFLGGDPNRPVRGGQEMKPRW
ncbi:entry exclusion protein TrbK [Ancylobacter polymorphus]|uniref:Ti type entry exclusion protein TrbK n=1 Tax=Ancylobacter polymorphus TaxID=223390 RepID=A0ABU0BI78_9HYPH|nr:entry exclusion protein TrbK [Ancylobacter polymorphus]MDQ0304988.1 Ti type entry exclusion protein TrbK [Ancylobacter polymorphus]